MRRGLNWIVIGLAPLCWFAGTRMSGGSTEPALGTTVQIRRDLELEHLLNRPNPAMSARAAVLLDEYHLDDDTAGIFADRERKPL